LRKSAAATTNVPRAIQTDTVIQKATGCVLREKYAGARIDLVNTFPIRTPLTPRAITKSPSRSAIKRPTVIVARLTVKLSGRPEAHPARRERKISCSARGAPPEDFHGPLQRWLEDAINQPTVRVRKLRSNEAEGTALDSSAASPTARTRTRDASNEGSPAPAPALFMTFRVSLGRGL